MELAIPTIGHCLACGYDLRGITAHECPECGRPFDAADPKTLRTSVSGAPDRFHRWLMTPPGFFWSLLAATVGLHMLWRARIPESGNVLEGLLAIGICAARFGAWHLTNQRYLDHAVDEPRLHRFAIAPLLIVFALVMSHLVFLLAMHISRPAMEAMARRAMDPRYESKRMAGWAGVYYIDDVVYGDHVYGFGPITHGKAQLICRQMNAVYVIEDVQIDQPPTQHGAAYWRRGNWIEYSVE